MSTVAQLSQQLQQEITFELTTANQLLQQISAELQTIKKFTSLGGEFEANIQENASLLNNLMKLQNIDPSSLPQITRKPIDSGNPVTTGQNTGEEATMDES